MHKPLDDTRPTASPEEKAALMLDPIMVGIVDRLILDPMSAAEIAAEMSLPPEAIRRHLRRLHRLGVVERVGQTDRRGVAEFLYSHSAGSLRLEPDALEVVPRRQRDELDVRILRKIVGDATMAIDSGTYGSHPESAVIKMAMAVEDETELGRIARIHDALLEETIVIADRATGRLDRDDRDPIEAEAALILAPNERSAWLRRFEGALTAAPGRLSSRHRVDMLATVNDPVRAVIIDVLGLEPASANQIAETLGLPVTRCRMELKRLTDIGVAAIHDRRQRRGTTEYIYACRNRTLTMSTEEVASYEGDRLDAYRRESLTALFNDSIDGIRRGMFARHYESAHLSRVPMRVDAQGFAEISEAMGRGLELLFQIQEERLARWDRDDEPAPLVGTSGMLLFERDPHWRDRRER